MSFIIRTERLELIPATLEIITTDLHRRDQLAALLRAEIGAGWPPVLFDVPAYEYVKRALQNDPTLGGWTVWYWILRRPRVLIGMSGFKSRPVNGGVELGYGCLDKYQRRGFASEVVNGMAHWAFANGVERVLAETLPELIASQRVLAKCGFRFIGEGSEPGVIRFERRRPALA
ncbi:MAG TPA: GNAT family N-acetyltransferase [Verrucomicrobiae bacterium]|jgi:RimJ/RimL family protein N-acetyltransferase